MYVWFDALINYLSATGFPDAGIRAALARGPARRRQGHHPVPLRHLAGDAAERRAGPAPRGLGPRLRAVGGRQDVEDGGTAVSLDEAIERHGPDALRYFLLREVGFEADGNFTWDRFDERYTADLADGLGNLASRSLAMLAKYRDGVVPRCGRDDRAGRRRAGRRSAPTPRDGCASISAAGPRRRGRWWRRRTCTSSRPRPGRWPRRQGGRAGRRARGAGPRLYRLAVLAAPVHPGQSAASSGNRWD